MPPRRHSSHASSGTLLTTLGIGLLIFILLVLIAIPGVRRARAESRRQECIHHLAALEAAKEHYAVDSDLKNGAEVPLAVLIEKKLLLLNNQPLDRPPVCPSGGRYSLKPVGKPASCSWGHGHALPYDTATQASRPKP